MDMPSLFKQTAVAWAVSGVNDYGNTVFTAAVEVPVRWQRKREEFTNSAGDKEVSQSVIYHGDSAVMVVDTLLYEGELSDLTAAEIADPTQLWNAYPVKAIGSSPSVTGEEVLGKVWL